MAGRVTEGEIAGQGGVGGGVDHVFGIELDVVFEGKWFADGCGLKMFGQRLVGKDLW